MLRIDSRIERYLPGLYVRLVDQFQKCKIEYTLCVLNNKIHDAKNATFLSTLLTQNNSVDEFEPLALILLKSGMGKNTSPRNVGHLWLALNH